MAGVDLELELGDHEVVVVGGLALEAHVAVRRAWRRAALKSCRRRAVYFTTFMLWRVFGIYFKRRPNGFNARG